ncbi:MAG: hypothetical protein JWP91_1263 [Fibrobacteres bacterium]|nr:hypothetical protein [Fibrobacterota bacterium]
MKIDGKTPTQGPDARRFSAGKSAPPKEGGKSFGAALKKAAEAARTVPGNPIQTAQEPAQPAPAPAAPIRADGSPAAVEGKDQAEPANFADHMELVKFRLKSGYYTNTKVDEALTEKLTGYFDDLA